MCRKMHYFYINLSFQKCEVDFSLLFFLYCTAKNKILGYYVYNRHKILKDRIQTSQGLWDPGNYMTLESLDFLLPSFAQIRCWRSQQPRNTKWAQITNSKKRLLSLSQRPGKPPDSKTVNSWRITILLPNITGTKCGPTLQPGQQKLVKDCRFSLSPGYREIAFLFSMRRLQRRLTFSPTGQ